MIGYGGDGTLNQVVNGVMAAKRRRSVVGLIPGGTANVWAHEIGLPDDPVKASLLLVNSEGRKVDLGHVGVDSLHLPSTKNEPPGKPRPPSGGRHHFLLMAGLGIDAAVMRRVSAPLKERIGQAAVALAAAKELPFQHAFPIEIASSVAGGERAVLWKGEALQVIVGNTRRYGNIAEVTGDAHIDDGLLDVGIITAGDPLSTMEQVLAALLHREPAHGRSEYFRGRRFWITAPASVGLQLDGSRVKLKDYLAGPDRAALGEAEHPEAVLVTYRFDAMPKAVHLAIPRSYDGALFEGGAGKEGEREDGVGGDTPGSEGGRQAEPVDALLEEGRRITVVAVGPNPGAQGNLDRCRRDPGQGHRGVQARRRAHRPRHQAGHARRRVACAGRRGEAFGGKRDRGGREAKQARGDPGEASRRGELTSPNLTTASAALPPPVPRPAPEATDAAMPRP